MATRDEGRARRNLLIAVGAATAAVVAGAVAGIKRLFDPHVVPHAMGGPMFVFTIEGEQGERVRVMGSGKALQSATYLDERRWDLPFEYYRAFDVALGDDLPRAEDGMLDVLMLGGGGFSWPKHALHERDGVRVDVVERDPAMVEAARKWFFLDELEETRHVLRDGRMRIFTDDAAAYLRGCSKRYAAVINDAFVGDKPVESLLGSEALGNVRRCLLPGGIYVINVPERAGNSKRLQQVADAVEAALGNVRVLPCTDEELSDDDNYLVIGSNESMGT